MSQLYDRTDVAEVFEGVAHVSSEGGWDDLDHRIDNLTAALEFHLEEGALRERAKMDALQRTQLATFSGQPVEVAHPERTTILPSDLFAGLHGERRYNGQTSQPWSVLQHLALCVTLAQRWGKGRDPVVLAQIAAHDFSEAYIKDLPRGLKEVLPRYREIEAAWEAHIWRSLGLPAPTGNNLSLVKWIDHRALLVEMDCLGFSLLHVLEGQWKGWPVVRGERGDFWAVMGAAPKVVWEGVVWDAVQKGREG